MTLIQWLGNGGAFGVLGLLWIGLGVAYANYAGRLGRRYDAPNDGCLLGFACVVLTLIGGAVGLLALDRHFPWFVLSSAAGAASLPALACLLFNRRMREWAPRRAPHLGHESSAREFTGDDSDESPLE